jgi:surface protein
VGHARVLAYEMWSGMCAEGVARACVYAVFSFASSFNQPLADWDVGQVTNMGSSKSRLCGRCCRGHGLGGARAGASLRDVAAGVCWGLCVHACVYAVFDRASSFNQPLANWDVSQVTYMYRSKSRMCGRCCCGHGPGGARAGASLRDVAAGER